MISGVGMNKFKWHWLCGFVAIAFKHWYAIVIHYVYCLVRFSIHNNSQSVFCSAIEIMKIRCEWKRGSSWTLFGEIVKWASRIIKMLAHFDTSISSGNGSASDVSSLVWWGKVFFLLFWFLPSHCVFGYHFVPLATNTVRSLDANYFITWSMTSFDWLLADRIFLSPHKLSTAGQTKHRKNRRNSWFWSSNTILISEEKQL